MSSCNKQHGEYGDEMQLRIPRVFRCTVCLSCCSGEHNTPTLDAHVLSICSVFFGGEARMQRDKNRSSLTAFSVQHFKSNSLWPASRYTLPAFTPASISNSTRICLSSCQWMNLLLGPHNDTPTLTLPSPVGRNVSLARYQFHPGVHRHDLLVDVGQQQVSDGGHQYCSAHRSLPLALAELRSSMHVREDVRGASVAR